MANAVFDVARSQFMQGTLTLTDSIKVIGVDHADDTPVVATDDFLDDILAAARVFTSGALATKTYAAGVLDADDLVVPTVSGDTFESYIFFNDTPGTEATKDLVAFCDTQTGIPLTPNGADITFAWDAGANRIFKL
jgi:hypothetical protein